MQLDSKFSPRPFVSHGSHSSQLLITRVPLLHSFLASIYSGYVVRNNPSIKLSSIAQFGCKPSASCWDLDSDLCTEQQGSCNDLFHLLSFCQYNDFSEMSPGTEE